MELLRDGDFSRMPRNTIFFGSLGHIRLVTVPVGTFWGTDIQVPKAVVACGERRS